jgi:uncharacterized RDD family membrane protein YckC
MREPAFRASYPVAEDRAAPGPYATRRRLGAWLLDTILVGLATAAVFHVFSDDIVRALVRADGPLVLLRALLALPAALLYGEAALAPAARGATLQTALAPALWVVLSVLYHGLAEHLFGNTSGQYMHGLLVARREDRGRPSLSAAILRAAARPIDGLLFGLFGLLISHFAGDGRRLGDLLAGTLVLDSAEAIRVLPTMDLAVARTRREIRAKNRRPSPSASSRRRAGNRPGRTPLRGRRTRVRSCSMPGSAPSARRSRRSRRQPCRWCRRVGGCSSTPFTPRWAVFHAS